MNKSEGLLLSRVLTLWWLKSLGTSLFIWFFFVAYFYLLRHPTYEVTTLPLLAWDGFIPYTPLAWLIYFSLWLYTALPLAMLTSFIKLVHFGLGIGLVCFSGLFCFYFWPTAIPSHYLFAAGTPENWLTGIDASGNACPSLHVASAIFSYIWLRQQLFSIAAKPFLHWVNGFWCFAIVLSTLSVRQHILVDVLGGALLGSFIGLFTARDYAKRFPSFTPSR